jgi:serine/threonine protein kinase
MDFSSAGVFAGACIIAAGIVGRIVARRRGSRWLGGGGGIGGGHGSSDLQRRRRSRKDMKEIEGMLRQGGAAKIYAYKDLERATKGFSEERRLGSGAFGTVYAGKLPGGMVAVKRLNYRYMQGIEQVVNEVKVLTAVKHPNLVRLLGCCLELGDPLLVYEYVPNGTLAEHLHGFRIRSTSSSSSSSSGSSLPWPRRARIALETAQALAYLHSLDPPIYHRDVKTTNILLGFDFTSKVADFGLSRLVLTDRSHVSTVPQGTPGYLDPDYRHHFHLSAKTDVYSFGVVLVELLTGLKPVDFSRPESEVNLASLALARIAAGSFHDLIDPSIDDEDPAVRSLVQTATEIAFRCLSHDRDARPTICEVAQELELVASESMKLLAPGLWCESSQDRPRLRSPVP